MDRPIIEMKNISKFYKIHKNKPSTFKEKILNTFKGESYKEEIIQKKVIEDFSMEIYAGETIGIIGENGAGKSTTLKLIANIIEPDNGEIFVNGTVASLLEIGAGFQADLTGTENVYLYGTILGLPKKVIDLQFQNIVNFAEISDFMNTQVKNYSSGMYMRLAFSVAIHVDPDIILIDEVLAVGDINFQKKCISKLEEFQRNKKTIVFVSHDMNSVRRLCNKVIYIYDNGKYKIGTPEQMVNLYFSRIYNTNEINGNKSHSNISGDLDLKHIGEIITINSEENGRSRWGNYIAQISEVYLSKTEGFVTGVFETGQDIVINIRATSVINLQNVVVGLAIYDEKKQLLCGPNSKDDGLIIEKFEKELFSKIIIRNCPLLEGDYLLSVALYDFDCKEPFDHMEKYFKFRINNPNQILGKFKLNCEWIF